MATEQQSGDPSTKNPLLTFLDSYEPNVSPKLPPAHMTAGFSPPLSPMRLDNHSSQFSSHSPRSSQFTSQESSNASMRTMSNGSFRDIITSGLERLEVSDRFEGVASPMASPIRFRKNPPPEPPKLTSNRTSFSYRKTSFRYSSGSNPRLSLIVVLWKIHSVRVYL